MRVYNNKVIADVGYYLQYQTLCGFSLPLIEGAEYTQHKISDDVSIQEGYALIGNKFFWSMEDTKAKVIKQMFNYDEQIAIILNRNESEEDKSMFELMQGWRQFVSDRIRIARNLINTQNEDKR